MEGRENMPKKAEGNQKISLPKSEEYLLELELLNRVIRNKASFETEKKKSNEPLYLERYE